MAPSDAEGATIPADGPMSPKEFDSPGVLAQFALPVANTTTDARITNLLITLLLQKPLSGPDEVTTNDTGGHETNSSRTRDWFDWKATEMPAQLEALHEQKPQ
jgi:hypothetical protein